MTIIQQPDAVSFCGSLKDLIVDTENTIAVTIALNGQTVIEESYSPDVNYKVRLWGLGKFLSSLLYGSWDSSDKMFGNVKITIDGTSNIEFVVLQQHRRTATREDGSQFLTTCREISLNDNEQALIPFFSQQLPIKIKYAGVNGADTEQTLVPAPAGNTVSSVTVSSAVLKALIGESLYSSLYEFYLKCGNDSILVHRDISMYAKTFQFRFMNNFDIPEFMFIHGNISQKPNINDNVERMEGVDRKFTVESSDEYGAESGAILLQSEYRRWHDMMNSQQVELLLPVGFVPILITKLNYERSLDRGSLIEVKFNFKMARTEDNGLMKGLI